MQKACKWFWMLNKRLYKKPSFVALLLIIVAAVCALTVMVRTGTSGFAHVVLAQEDPEDALANEIIRDLLAEDSLLRYTRVATPQQAEKMVQRGEADSAWVFYEDTAGQLSQFAEDRDAHVVRVWEREQNVLLRLSREKLHGKLYEYASRAFFVQYARENLELLDHLSDQQVLQYFEDCKINDNLFIFDDVEGGSSTALVSHYLISPLRGVLSLIAVLGGLAAVLYCMQDREKGTFAWASAQKRFFIEAMSILTATLHVSLVSSITLWISGIYQFGWQEIVGTLCYALCCAAFGLVVKCILRNVKLLSSVIPALMVVLCGLCPVFFNIKQVRALAMLFPPTYYINAAFNAAYLWYMLLYVVCCVALTFGLEWVIAHPRFRRLK